MAWTLAEVLESRLSESLLASELGRGGGSVGSCIESNGRSELIDDLALEAKVELFLRAIPAGGGRTC